MAEHPLQGMMGITMDKVREMVDSSTIIGDPIKVDADTTIIPVSRVTFGFASGGSGRGGPRPARTCSAAVPAQVSRSHRWPF